MRVKVLLALAIASVLLLCSAGMAFAQDCGCGAVPSSSVTADDLTAAAVQDIAGFGFPDLSSIDSAVAVPADTIEATELASPVCGVCGSIPECTCTETTNVVPGPEVNLGCPLITTFPVPVNLVSPTITPVFPAINVAPQVCLGLPQVNTQLNCLDIACQPVTNYNSCPIC